MAIDTTPLQRAFNNFLMAMPPCELEELLRYLHDYNTSAVDHVPQISEATSRTHESAINGADKAGFGCPDTRSKATASRGRRFREGKLRPLNSFIAFRSYYSAAFPQFTQKAKSGILRFLWEHDPLKAKWAILAKAYSIIRDNHVGQVSLDTFLALNCHFVGLVEPQRYLTAMGWELIMDENHQYTMVRASTALATETEASIDYSVNDILNHCYETGYIKCDSGNRTIGNLTQNSLMSFSTPPNVANNGPEIDAGIFENSEANASSHIVTDPIIDVHSPSMILNDLDIDGTSVNENAPAISQLLELRDGPRSQQEFITELDDALNDLRGPNPDDDDLFSPFNPEIENPLFHYDPLSSEPFDGFDIHEFMNV